MLGWISFFGSREPDSLTLLICKYVLSTLRRKTDENKEANQNKRHIETPKHGHEMNGGIWSVLRFLQQLSDTKESTASVLCVLTSSRLRLHLRVGEALAKRVPGDARHADNRCQDAPTIRVRGRINQNTIYSR